MSTANRILIVDDLEIFRELGAIFLARSGPVDLARNANEAFEIACARKPQVVIADMHLPDMSGTELCHRFKHHPDLDAPRVLLLARPGSREDHAEAVRAGADEVLFKPLERDALIAGVRRLTDFETPRGLPRARIDQRIEISARGARIEGKVRNVSRGGLLVDTPAHFGHSEEVALSFSLDGNGAVVSPTAQVVWTDAQPDGSDLIGLRFLEIDPQTISKLEHYVSDHYPRTQSVPG
jgi:DNA-binding response OmpR family regulator